MDQLPRPLIQCEGDVAVSESLRKAPDPTLSSTGALMGKRCAAFEAACEAGVQPQIEDFLNEFPEPQRTALLYKLIQVERHHRRRRGAPVPPEDYLRRFPVLVLELLAEAALAAPLIAEVSLSQISTQPARPKPPDAPPLVESVNPLACPHCHRPIQVARPHAESILCPVCGSSFRIADFVQVTTE